jgi:hypothetical protein
MNRIMTQARFCDACNVAHCDLPCPLTITTQATPTEVPPVCDSLGFPFSKLPAEIRLDIYDEICARAIEAERSSNLELEWQDVGVIIKNNRILLEAERLPAIIKWIRGPYNAAFRGLVLASKELNREVSQYVSKANAARIKNIRVEVIWFEDLGHLLVGLGPQGRSNLTHIEFTWDNLVRPLHDGTQKIGPVLWRTVDGPAKIFTMLAACKNLVDVTVKMDTYRLLNMRSDEDQQFDGHRRLLTDLQGIPGMMDLRDVKVNGDLKIQNSARSSVEVGPWSEPFREWLMAGMKMSKQEVTNRAIVFASEEDKRVARIKTALEKHLAAKLAAAELAFARHAALLQAESRRRFAASVAGDGDDPDDDDYIEP